MYDKADDTQIKAIFKAVDLIEPTNVRRRVQTGERIANDSGLTLMVKQREGTREFNPYIRRT